MNAALSETLELFGFLPPLLKGNSSRASLLGLGKLVCRRLSLLTFACEIGKARRARFKNGRRFANVPYGVKVEKRSKTSSSWANKFDTDIFSMYFVSGHLNIIFLDRWQISKYIFKAKTFKWMKKFEIYSFT